MSQSIAGTQIFRDDMERADFAARPAARCREGHVVVYAWARIPNQFHLRVRPGQSPLVRRMTKLRTGDGATVNRRHKGSGHLVQNRVAWQGMVQAPLARHVSPGEGVAEPALRSGSRRLTIVSARRLSCQVAVQMRYSGAGVAPHLGVTISAVNRLAASAEPPEVTRYLRAL
jgi:hypothetical protein